MARRVRTLSKRILRPRKLKARVAAKVLKNAANGGAKEVVASHRWDLLFFLEWFPFDLYRLLAGKIGRAGLENSCCEYLEVRNVFVLEQ